MNTIVKLKKLTPNAIIPTYGTAQSAGADLYSGMEQPVTIEPGKTEFIHTGIAIAIPEGLVGAQGGQVLHGRRRLDCS